MDMRGQSDEMATSGGTTGRINLNSLRARDRRNWSGLGGPKKKKILVILDGSARKLAGSCGGFTLI